MQDLTDRRHNGTATPEQPSFSGHLHWTPFTSLPAHAWLSCSSIGLRGCESLQNVCSDPAVPLTFTTRRRQPKSVNLVVEICLEKKIEICLFIFLQCIYTLIEFEKMFKWCWKIRVEIRWKDFLMCEIWLKYICWNTISVLFPYIQFFNNYEAYPECLRTFDISFNTIDLTALRVEYKSKTIEPEIISCSYFCDSPKHKNLHLRARPVTVGWRA